MEELRDTHDKIRMNYWQWKIDKLAHVMIDTIESKLRDNVWLGGQ